MIDRIDLQIGQSRCCSSPERVFLYFTEKFSCGLPRKPSIPVWSSCEQPRKVVWEELGKRTGDGEFLLVGLAYSFEPQGRAIRLESNQAERGAGIQLADIPVEMETQWCDYRLDPLAQFLEPAQSCEWASRRLLPLVTR